MTKIFFATFLFISSTLNLECSSFRQMSSFFQVSYCTWHRSKSIAHGSVSLLAPAFQSLARVQSLNFSPKSCLASTARPGEEEKQGLNNCNVCFVDTEKLRNRVEWPYRLPRTRRALEHTTTPGPRRPAPFRRAAACNLPGTRCSSWPFLPACSQKPNRTWKPKIRTEHGRYWH